MTLNTLPILSYPDSTRYLVAFTVTKRNEYPKVKLTCRHAASEGVTGVTRTTGTDGIVIHYRTRRVCAATARARVAALLIYTRARTRTLGIDRALWPATRRHSHVTFETRAGRALAAHLTHRVRTARTRLTRFWIIC